jgi:hypothetical protein
MFQQGNHNHFAKSSNVNRLSLTCLFALPCLALPCLALPCLALPCLALPILPVTDVRQRLDPYPITIFAEESSSSKSQLPDRMNHRDRITKLSFNVSRSDYWSMFITSLSSVRLPTNNDPVKLHLFIHSFIHSFTHQFHQFHHGPKNKSRASHSHSHSHSPSTDTAAVGFSKRLESIVILLLLLSTTLLYSRYEQEQEHCY